MRMFLRGLACTVKHSYILPAFLFWPQLSKIDREVLGDSCDCRCGAAGNCKHCAAIAGFVNKHEDESCTSKLQTWRRPSKAACGYKSTITKLFDCK